MPVTEYENDLVLDINGKTAEHRPHRRRQGSECIEHKLMGRNLAPLDHKIRVVDGIPANAATGVRHGLSCRPP